MRQKGNVQRIAAICYIHRENRTIMKINNGITLVRGASPYPQSNYNIQYWKRENIYFKLPLQAGICTEMAPAGRFITAISFCSNLSAHCVTIFSPSIITIFLYRKSVRCHQRLIISATVKITERANDGSETEN